MFGISHLHSVENDKKANAGCTPRVFSLLVITSPAHDVLPIICIDYTYDSDHGIAEGVPPSVSMQ